MFNQPVISYIIFCFVFYVWRSFQYWESHIMFAGTLMQQLKLGYLIDSFKRHSCWKNGRSKDGFVKASTYIWFLSIYRHLAVSIKLVIKFPLKLFVKLTSLLETRSLCSRNGITMHECLILLKSLLSFVPKHSYKAINDLFTFERNELVNKCIYFRFRVFQLYLGVSV